MAVAGWDAIYASPCEVGELGQCGDQATSFVDLRLVAKFIPPHKRNMQVASMSGRLVSYLHCLGQHQTRAGSSGGSCTTERSRPKERNEKLWQNDLFDSARPPGNWQDNKRPLDHKALEADKHYKPTSEDSHVALWRARVTSDAFASTSENDAGRSRMDRYTGALKVGDSTKFYEELQLSEAVDALDLLVQRGSFVDSSNIYGVLKRCIAQKDLVLGRRVHALSVKSGYESSKFLANHIMRMYASHGRLHEATQVFRRISAPDTFMWNSIITAYAEHKQPVKAIKLYHQMRQTSLEPNSYVFVAVLKACAAAADLASGKKVHADIMRSAVEQDVFVESCLVDMYSKCGSLEDARRVFDNLPTKNVVTWTALIAGYVQHGLGLEAFTIYESMQQDNMTIPNNVTFVCLLQACSSVGWLDQGKRLHAQIEERGLEADVVVGSSLVDMYAKCGSFVDARRVFDNLPFKNVVTWNAMIAGCVQHRFAQEALSLYVCMEQEGVSQPDHFTFSCLLQACAIVGAVHQGKQLHAQIRERGLEFDVVVGSCLVEMYAKCGRLLDAREVVDRLESRDVVTWTALLNGYAENSDGQMAIQCFEEMRQQGVRPNDVTFLCLLVACSHAGLVKEGLQYFKMMSQACDIVPNVEHYNCMVDLLGRSGCLGEAENILRDMPFQNDIVGWTSLLSACKSHGDVECGRRCFDQIMQLEPGNASAYVLLGNIFANAGMWGDVDAVESLRRAAGAKKKPATACIEVKNKVYEFTVGEERGEVSTRLRSMNSRVKEGGHVPHTELVLKTASNIEKEDALCGHAEKLALAYGLMNTPDSMTLLVTKNLRMCNDCHSSTKVMSRLEKREIVVRDGHRVHRFTDGFCSCGDRH